MNKHAEWVVGGRKWGHLSHIRAPHRSMSHHAGTLADGSQSAWKVDSTCTLQLQACPVAHTRAANSHFLGSLGGRILDCWWVELWIYFTEPHQGCTLTCSYQCTTADRNHTNGTPLCLFLPPPQWWRRWTLGTAAVLYWCHHLKSLSEVSDLPLQSMTHTFFSVS